MVVKQQFDRSLPARSCTETICNNILINLSDNAKYVEYWRRDEWIHLDAHKDVDEHLAKQTTPSHIMINDCFFIVLGFREKNSLEGKSN